MINVIDITFLESVPPPEAIQMQISDLTGLAIEMRRNSESSGVFMHREFKKPCEFKILEQSVTLDLPVGQWSYLDWLTIAALINLGGRYEGESLPQFTKIKWRDRKLWQFLPR